MNKPEWFAAKTVCKHQTEEDGAAKTVYEERVVLLAAVDFSDALIKGEQEARQYCDSIECASYTGYINVYQLSEEAVGHGTEIFSLLRDSELSETDYLDRFIDTGRERSRLIE
jgi:hypothetical protein